MYSGHNLIYGFKVYKKDLKEIFNIEDDNYYVLVSIIDEILTDNFELLNIITMPCCYDTGRNFVFIGFMVGMFSVQYRDYVGKHINFAAYIEDYTQSLKELEDNFKNNQNKIEKELNEIKKLYPELSDFGELSFFTIPDDCESCT